MIGSEIKSNATSLQQIPKYSKCETQTTEYMIDCYPYAMRGFLFGLLFSIIFLGSIISVLMLVP